MIGAGLMNLIAFTIVVMESSSQMILSMSVRFQVIVLFIAIWFLAL